MAKGLEDEMRADLESKDVTISKLQGKLTVNILDRVMFDSGEAILKPGGETVMRKIAALLFASLFFSLTPLVHADVAAIHADRLPQETAILAALDDAREMEPYSHVWWPECNFPLSKQEVAKHLSKDLGSLVHALQKHPENEELALLTGLVGRYAYNVDVKGSQNIPLSALSQAQTLDPKDVRAPWFRATFLCETLQPVEGEHEFLFIEAGRPWDRLPPAFWIDYMECASHTNMSAHVLRAADHLEKLHGAATPLSNTYLNKARRRFDAFDPKKNPPLCNLFVQFLRRLGAALRHHAVPRAGGGADRCADRLAARGGACAPCAPGARIFSRADAHSELRRGRHLHGGRGHLPAGLRGRPPLPGRARDAGDRAGGPLAGQR